MSTVTVVLSRKSLKEGDYCADRPCDASLTYANGEREWEWELDDSACQAAVEVLAHLYKKLSKEMDWNTEEKGDKTP